MRAGAGVQIVGICLLVSLLLNTGVNTGIAKGDAKGETVVLWDTDVDFSAGSLTNLSISGTGTAAVLTMSYVDAWLKLSFAEQPSAREGCSMVFADGIFVLFGGRSGTQYFNDTWVFSEGKWIKKSGINAPEPRAFSGMAYSQSNGTVYLFGGRNATGVFGDLWTYNLTADTWTKITTSAPQPRYGCTLTYYPPANKLLLFGGNNSTTALNDLWEYTPSTNSWLYKSSSPIGRYFHGMVFAPQTGLLYVFGGLNATALSNFYQYNYSTNSWVALSSPSPPSPRYGHIMGYLNGSIVVASGSNGSSNLSDTWRFSISANSWQQLSLSLPVSPVVLPGVAFSPLQIFSAGGLNTQSQSINQFLPAFTNGIFETQGIDTQRTHTSYLYLRWNPPLQTHGAIRCQIAANDDNTTWVFKGPDGTSSSYYENGFGQKINASGRYIKVRAYFISENGIYSPFLDSISISFNRPPDAPTPLTPSGICQNHSLNFAWNFNDIDMDYQTAFRVQVSTSSDFNSPVVDSGVVQSAAQSWTYSGLGDGVYYWRVACRDSSGLWNVSNGVQFTLDTTPPSASLTINSNAVYTNTPSVTLTITSSDAGSGLRDMCFSNDGLVWSAHETPVATKSWTLSEGDGVKVVYLKLRDNANNSFICNDTIILDTTPPSATITINNDTLYTNTENVYIQVYASDATSGVDAIRLSNDGNSWGEWQSITQNIPWTLQSGDGLKKVYAQVRDKSGLTTTTADTIYLDKSPPPPPQFYPEPPYTPGYSNTVSWYPVEDAISGNVAYNVECSTTPSFSWTASSGWIYSTTYTFTSLSEGYTYYYRVRARDGLGNIGAYSQIVNSTQDATAPITTITTPDEIYFNAENIVLSWKAVDYTSGLSGRYRVQISGDNTFLTTVIDTYVSGSTSALETIYHAPALQDGKYFWRVMGEDNAGNWGAYSSISTFYVCSSKPRIVCNAYVYGWYSANPGSVIDVDFYAQGIAPLSTARWRLPGGEWHIVFQGAYSEYTQNWGLPWEEMGEGTNQINVEVIDAAGNSEEAIIYFLKDVHAPQTSASISGLLGMNGWYLSNVSVHLFATDEISGISKIIYRIFDGVIWSDESEYSGEVKLNRSGIYTIEFYSIDRAGNYEEKQRIEIKIDMEVPETFSDAGSGWYSVLPVFVNLTANDRISEISGIYYSIDSGNYIFEQNFTIQISLSTEGVHLISYFAVDHAGNREVEKRVTVLIDTTPPTTNAIIERTGENATLRFSANDTISGVNQTIYWVFNNTTGNQELYCSGVYVEPVNLTEGNWTILYYSIDCANNHEILEQKEIIIDWQKPSVSITINNGSCGTHNRTVWISVNWSDNLGIAGISFSNDFYNWTALQLPETMISWELPDEDGEHTVYCKVVDYAGNENITSWKIYLDRKAPQIFDFSVPSLVCGNSTLMLRFYLSENAQSSIYFLHENRTDVIAENLTTTEFPWHVPLLNCEGILYLKVCDPGGNEAEFYSNSFRVDSTPPDVESVHPEVAEPRTWIEITFTEDMDKEAAERSFVIQPYVSGKFYWSDNRTLIFVPERNLDEGATYSIIIKSDARDLAGNHISQRVSFVQVKSYLYYYVLLGVLITSVVAVCIYWYYKRKKRRKMQVKVF
ncbi:MAG: Kelch repeat-containing protein [Thermoplasmata archaeon]